MAAGILAAPIHWCVLIGGQTVISVFDANVKNWTGHRHDTMVDNTVAFVLLLAVQLAILSWFVALRLNKGKTWRDPPVCGIGIFMLMNAFLSMDWPWYGT